jgi:hypothetical protein
MNIIRNTIDDDKFTPENLPAFEAKLFFDTSYFVDGVSNRRL